MMHKTYTQTVKAIKKEKESLHKTTQEHAHHPHPDNPQSYDMTKIIDSEVGR